ncbi:MAG TPA: hypothetical protein GYA10_07990 [Alphaproteobacteria bacterium]|nr:hypothetical protein [Alphaproteobacteria bacterium]
MDLLLLLVFALPLLWLFFLPARVLNRFARMPIFKPTIVMLVLLTGWAVVTGLGGSGTPEADYARGDTQLRALLE